MKEKRDCIAELDQKDLDEQNVSTTIRPNDIIFQKKRGIRPRKSPLVGIAAQK